MKVEIGTEAAPFPEKEHKSIIFVAVHPIDVECQGMFHQLSPHRRGQYRVEGGSRARILKRLRMGCLNIWLYVSEYNFYGVWATLYAWVDFNPTS
jgi:hypothetical protein